MNFVIGDYTTPAQTEASYLNRILNIIGCTSVLWDGRSQSAYDLFDTIRPDYYISHISSVSNEAISYIKENKKTKMILNVSGSNNDIVKYIQKTAKENNVEIALLFTNGDAGEFDESSKVMSIGLGADLFLNSPKMDFQIDRAYVMVNSNSPKDFDGSYHTITCMEQLERDVDIFLSVDQMPSIYANYNKLIFRNCTEIVPQIFYDAVYHANFVCFDIDDEKTRTETSNKLKRIFRTEMDLCDESSISIDEIKVSLSKRHTCYHRAKSLLSQLPAKKELESLNELIDKLKL